MGSSERFIKETLSYGKIKSYEQIPYNCSYRVAVVGSMRSEFKYR